MTTPIDPTPAPAVASPAPQSNPPEQAIAPWLQMLSQLYPPTSILLVGAGSGTGAWVQTLQTLGITSATLVEADDTQFENLQRNLQSQPGWRLRKQVVAAQTEPVTFYLASLAPESGLLPPDSLRSLWPNLKTLHQQTRQAVTLSHIQADAHTDAGPANWLLVDCLPALPILQGADPLAAFDVIALRVVLGEHERPHPEATIQNARALLQAQGFRCLAIETSRHPAMGHALFVRDTVAQTYHLQKQLELQAQNAQTQAQTLVLAQVAAAQAQAAKAAKEALVAQAAAEANKQAQEHSALVQQLTQAKAAAEELATERQLRIDHLDAKAKEAFEQAKTANVEAAAAIKQAKERAIQVQQLTQAKAAAEKLADKRLQRIDQLLAQAKQATESATAAASKQAQVHAAQVQQLTQSKAAAEKLATERQKQIEQLQAQAKQTAEEAKAAVQNADYEAIEQVKEAKETAEAATDQALEANHQAQVLTALVQQLTHDKAAADQLLGERLAQIQAHEQCLQELQTQAAKTEHVNALLQTEAAKAEVQMSLLKELFFRGQGQ